MLERGLKIAEVNWKHNLFPHVLLAAALLLAAPLVMGIKNLDEPQVARIIDFYLCFQGVLLLIPLYMPDGSREIRDLAASKKMSITIVRLIRLVEAYAITVLFLFLFLCALRQGGCSFQFGRCFYAALSNCAAMGGLGLFFYSITDSIIVAYMAPIIYYVASMGAGKKYMGKFWLMSFVGSDELLSVANKGYIFAAGLILTAASLFLKWKRRT